MNMYERNFYVEICDIDTKNELTNYGILRIMQEIAAAHSDNLGISINHIKEKPYTWLLLNWKLQVFLRPAWNSKLTVKTWPSSADKLYSYRDFEIYTENNEMVAKATSKWVLININTLIIEKTSQEILDIYKPSNTSVFEDSIPKLKEPKEHDIIENYVISRNDLDINGHANNLSYLKIATNILPKDIYNNADFRNLEIMYKKECKLGDEVAVLYSKTDNTHTITIKSKDLSVLHCIIQMQCNAY